MKVGDLVKMKWEGNGYGSVGIIYLTVEEADKVYKCMWDVPMWNNTPFHEHELELVNEGG